MFMEAVVQIEKRRAVQALAHRVGLGRRGRRSGTCSWLLDSGCLAPPTLLADASPGRRVGQAGAKAAAAGSVAQGGGPARVGDEAGGGANRGPAPSAVGECVR